MSENLAYDKVAMLLHVVTNTLNMPKLKLLHDHAMKELEAEAEKLAPPKPEPVVEPEAEPEHGSDNGNGIERRA